MTNYYVATTGSNASAGTTPQAPWSTIAYAVTQVTAGDTIYLMPGTYAETGIAPAVSGTSGSRITLTSYDRNNQARIQAAGTASLQFLNVSYWTVSYIKFGAASNPAPNYLYQGAVMIGSYGSTLHTTDTTYITVDNCEISWTNKLHCILLVSTNATYGPKYCRITNNYIHDFGGDPTSYNEVITQAGNVAYTLVEKNRLINVAYIGINHIGQDGSATYPGAAQPRYSVIRGNFINYVKRPELRSGSPGVAIKVDGGGPNILIENNITKLAAGCVVGCEPWYDNGLTNIKNIIVRNNVFDVTGSYQDYAIQIGVGSGGMSTDKDKNYMAKLVDSVIAHNVLIGAAFAALLHRAESTIIKNNVVTNTLLFTLYSSELLTRDAALTTSGNAANGNLYYSSNSNKWMWYGGSATYADFALWQATGQDANSVYGEPIYTNKDNNDYTLTALSPGSGDGIALTTTTNAAVSPSTSMTVANADYFCNGYGLVGGDIINVGGTQMTITAVNYSTNTLTLATPATWSNGASVHYVYGGTAPSMGLTASVSSGEIIEIIDDDDDGGDSGGGTGSGNTTRYTVQVGGTSSNCYRRESDTGFDTTDLLFSGDYTSESYDYTAGMRFALPLDIEPGRIGTAYLKLNASFVVGSSWPLRIYGEQTDNSVAFSDATDFDARTRTTAYVDWSPSVSVGGAYTSPDITSILQELANDYDGLSSGDYVTLFVTSQTAGFGNFGLVGWTDYDTSASGAPTLEINYTNAAANNGTVTLQVTHGYDDTSGSNANYYPTSTTGFIGDNTAGDYDYTTGCRFVLSEAIPATATITNAYLTLKSAGYVTAIPAMQIKGEDVSASARFTDKTNFDGRARTTASVNWTPGAWVTGTDYNSPDLSTIVQELVDDNSGLTMGAGITMFVGTQVAGWGGSQALAYAYTYDNTPSFAPKLIIEWETPSGGRGYGTGLAIGMRIGSGV